jgi:hypothetical protein
VLFWLLILAVPVLTFNWHRTLTLQQALLFYTGFGLLNISAFYVNLLWLLPKLMQKQKLWLLFLSWMVMILLYTGLKIEVSRFLPAFPVNSDAYRQAFSEELIMNIFVIGFFIAFSTFYKLVADWLNTEKIREQMEHAHTEAELQFLKAQINPHFLFNTLNNIYTLAYQKSDKTTDAIMHLSQLMRYMLHGSNDDRVPLQQEIHYMEQLIALQQMRVNGTMYVQFETSGDLTRYQVAPFLLISFLENAFKHGVVNDPAHPMTISLKAENNSLLFAAANKVHNGLKDPSGGIGLGNVKRRLDLLYPKKHTLTIDRSGDYYTTHLCINYPAS